MFLMSAFVNVDFEVLSYANSSTLICFIFKFFFVTSCLQRNFDKYIFLLFTCVQVELVVMRCMARGLIKGSIDGVHRTVNVTWVQPRVLDNNQVRVCVCGKRINCV
jgi:hypothetical protein